MFRSGARDESADGVEDHVGVVDGWCRQRLAQHAGEEPAVGPAGFGFPAATVPGSTASATVLIALATGVRSSPPDGSLEHGGACDLSAQPVQ
ncbi:hypothetical protein [Nesterenkonia pannonica]|uniref:hypothetical protein n=1 Tax=Nesterenkonia pannonica TaxID=1548602 RepID=UPI002164BF5F|nr:hypothetical protein [Nesterenkonia pannonica]